MSESNKDAGETPMTSGPPEVPQDEQTDSSASRPVAEDIEDLKEEMTHLAAEKKEAHERYLRTYAEFENYKKRVTKDQRDQSRYANEQLLKALLPVLDNLARAIGHAKESGHLDKL